MTARDNHETVVDVFSAGDRPQGRVIGRDDDDAIRVEVDDKLFHVRLVDLPFASTRDPAGRGMAPRLVGVRTSHAKAGGNDVVAPMHGLIVALNVGNGAVVNEGDVVAVIEAMKMMNEIRAHKSGTVVKVHGTAGGSIEAGSPILTIDAALPRP